MAMMAITTNSSIRVKAVRCRGCWVIIALSFEIETDPSIQWLHDASLRWSVMSQRRQAGGDASAAHAAEIVVIFIGDGDKALHEPVGQHGLRFGSGIHLQQDRAQIGFQLRL